MIQIILILSMILLAAVIVFVIAMCKAARRGDAMMIRWKEDSNEQDDEHDATR